jgi:hypothetical protein
MSHSTHTESNSSNRRNFRASHSLHSAGISHGNQESEGIPPAFWPALGFGHRLETNSLWDTGLLDRLSAPLTRFHE